VTRMGHPDGTAVKQHDQVNYRVGIASPLRRVRLFSPQLLQEFQGLGGVNLHILGVLNDVADDTLLIYHEGDTTIRHAFFVIHAEGFGGCEGGKVRHQLEGQPAMVCKGLLRLSGVGAGTQYLGV
jgi:hypothetical protein